MSGLATTLQPNTRVPGNRSFAEPHTVVPVGAKGLSRCQMLGRCQQSLVHVPLVAGSKYDQVEVLMSFGDAFADLLERQINLAALVVYLDDFSERENAVLPVLLVRVVQALPVHVTVHLFDEFQADDTVVGGLVAVDLFPSCVIVKAIELVDLVRVEDLVHTKKTSMPALTLEFQ